MNDNPFETNFEPEKKKKSFVVNFSYDDENPSASHEACEEKTGEFTPVSDNTPASEPEAEEQFFPGPDDRLAAEGTDYIDSEDEYDKSSYFDDAENGDGEDTYDDEFADDDEPDEEFLKAEKRRIREEKRKKRAHIRRVKRRKRKTGVSLAISLVLTTLILGISVIVAVALIVIGKDFAGIGKSENETVFIVEEGDTAKEISEKLAEKGFISVPAVFRVVSKLSGADALYQAGEHIISPAMAYEGIIETLTDKPYSENVKRESVTVTFVEGITLNKAAQILEDNGVCKADDFIFTFNSKDFGYRFESDITSSSLKFYRKEGFLFPDTYTFYLKENPEVVCTKILYNFDKKFVDEYYDRLEELDMTVDELITLASIIQGEGNSIESMQNASSVFHNRLNNPTVYPKLQSDATSNYVRNVIEVNAQYVSDSMCSAYDTYEGSGLPPGAICNPGIDAIEAALYPTQTEYYYFYSDEYGTFYYAVTYDQHLANIERASNSVKTIDDTAE